MASAAEGEFDVKALIARADDALYRAKRAGRDCVEVAAASLPGAARLDVLTSDVSSPAEPLRDHGPQPMIPRRSIVAPVTDVA